MFLMYLDVKAQICCLMVLVSTCKQFFKSYGWMMGQVWGRNWSAFNKRIHNILLVVIGDFLDCCINL